MGLRDEISAELAAAFDGDLADAVSQFTGSRFEPSGPADPISQTQPGATVTYTGRGVFGSFDIEVIDGINILRTDVRLLALQVEVTGVPRVDDEINGMQVIQVGKDPADATWVIQLRGV